MSFTALTIAISFIAVLAASTFWIKAQYRTALTSVAEKQGGVVSYYRNRIEEIVSRQSFSTEHWVCAIHYVLLHLVTPFLLSAFLLHTDANFIIAIGAIIASLQLSQRLYPGVIADDE